MLIKHVRDCTHTMYTNVVSVASLSDVIHRSIEFSLKYFTQIRQTLSHVPYLILTR